MKDLGQQTGGRRSDAPDEYEAPLPFEKYSHSPSTPTNPG